MSRRIAVLVVLLAALAGAVSALPASLLGWAVARASSGQWTLVEEDGSFWQGSGQLAWHGAGGQDLPASRVSWRFEPVRLFRLHLAWQLEADGSRGRLWLAPGQLHAEALALRLPLAVLAQTTQWRDAGLSGNATLRVGALDYRKGQWQGGAELALDGVAARLSPLQPLGDYLLRAQADGSGFALELSSVVGPLKLSGSGHWQAGQGVRLQGLANASEQDAKLLRPVLLMLGTMQGPNQVSWHVGN
jgi:general secretion pathway protein N